MNKSELIEAIAATTESNKAEAGRALEAVLAAITSTLQAGEKVTIPGLEQAVLLHLKNVKKLLTVIKIIFISL